MGFAIIYSAKNDQTECFLSDFKEVNKRIVRKPFLLPKISTVMQELEGFTFATALDLHLGYYTIRLDPDSSAPLFFLGVYTHTSGYLWELLVLLIFFKQK